jgi:2-amino-4-hydroxy-6-hydroxymethyldihydropteridine diphosphokinase
MSSAILGLGSNLGNRLEHLQIAVDSLTKKVTLTKVSHVYQSESFYNTAEPPFLNVCVEIQTDKNPFQLLQFLQMIENQGGRPFPRPKDRAPRTIDIDILLFGDLIYHTDNLIIPHRELWERPFFLVPLVEIQPDAVCPLRKLKFKDRLNDFSPLGVYLVSTLF